jgi:hypothetical protein
MTDGVDLSKRLHAGHMPRDKAAAHARLASLPTVRHSRTERDVSEQAKAKAELAERLRRKRLENGNGYNFAPAEFGQRRAKHPALSGRTQRMAILEALRDGPLSGAEIAQRFACTRASARISDLRDLGHDIAVERVETPSGVVYRYRLIKEAR